MKLVLTKLFSLLPWLTKPLTYLRKHSVHNCKISRRTAIVQIQECFFKYNDVNKDRTADGLRRVLCKALEKFNIQNKLIGQTYDGASVMSMAYNQKFMNLHRKLCLLTAMHTI